MDIEDATFYWTINSSNSTEESASNFRIKPDPHLILRGRWQVALSHIYFSSGGFVDQKTMPSEVFVMSTICVPSLVGPSQRLPLLRVIPVQRSKGEDSGVNGLQGMSGVFDLRPQYHNIRVAQITSLDISVTDNELKPVQCSPNSSISLTLHFMKLKNQN